MSIIQEDRSCDLGYKAVFYTSNYNRKNHPNLLHTSKSYNNDGLVGFTRNGISGVVGSKRPNYEYIYDLFPIRKRKLNILWRCGLCSKTQIWVWASFLYELPTAVLWVNSGKPAI